VPTKPTLPAYTFTTQRRLLGPNKLLLRANSMHHLSPPFWITILTSSTLCHMVKCGPSTCNHSLQRRAVRLRGPMSDPRPTELITVQSWLWPTIISISWMFPMSLLVVLTFMLSISHTFNPSLRRILCQAETCPQLMVKPRRSSCHLQLFSKNSRSYRMMTLPHMWSMLSITTHSNSLGQRRRTPPLHTSQV